jgi:cation:H+ antiporter
MDILLFLLSFVIILVGCEFFTNGIEWAGRRFNLSEGCVGSVLAAVGTALPETVVPLIAILFLPGESESGQEIGVGAILGAPFMLATLALFVCGLSVLLFRKRRGTSTLHINGKLVRRDLAFFMVAYSLAAFAALAPPELDLFKQVLGFSLIPLYVVYVWYTVKTGEAACDDEELKDLYCHRVIGGLGNSRTEPLSDPVAAGLDKVLRREEPATWVILFQIAISLVAIIGGANIFVGQIQTLAQDLNINPLILALIIAPIATELPEKFNSFLWIREGKDTYAIGNITGAMVFQSCFPVTIGILLTSWHINLSSSVELLQAVAIAIALVTAVVLYVRSSHRELHISGLMLGGVMYALFIALVLLTI